MATARCDANMAVCKPCVPGGGGAASLIAYTFGWSVEYCVRAIQADIGVYSGTSRGCALGHSGSRSISPFANFATRAAQSAKLLLSLGTCLKCTLDPIFFTVSRTEASSRYKCYTPGLATRLQKSVVSLESPNTSKG